MNRSCLQMTAQNGDQMYAKNCWRENKNTSRNQRKGRNQKQNEIFTYLLFVLFIVYLLYHCVRKILFIFYLNLCAYYAQPTLADSGPFIIIIIKLIPFFALQLRFSQQLINTNKNFLIGLLDIYFKCTKKLLKYETIYKAY